MRRKYFFFTFVAAAMLLVSNLAVSAQTGQVFGEVMMQQADGTMVPAAGATIDVFRVDLPGKQSTKTDKKGKFVFAGLFYAGTYIIAASAPNARPDIVSDVKAGREVNYKLTLMPGDGKRLTDAEAKSLTKSAPANNTGGGESAEDRKKRLELEAKNAEITEGNKKIEEANAVVNRTAKAGNEFLAAKNYDAAITQYNEGIAIDPTHPGQPVLLTNKAVALTNRGIQHYNESIKVTDDAAKNSQREAAIKDWREAAESANKAVDFMKKEATPTEAAALDRYNKSKYLALLARAEAYRFLVPKDPTQADTGLMAYQEYIAVETDSAKKTKAQLDAAQMLLDSGSSDKAFAEFQKIAATDPENIDAMLGAGLALFQSGDKAKFQEAANYLQRFVDKAPETHKLRASAKDALDYLKSQENVKPQKTTTTTGGRRRG